MPTMKGLKRNIDTIDIISNDCLRVYVDVEKNIYYDIYKNGKIVDNKGKVDIIEDIPSVEDFFINFKSIEANFLIKEFSTV